MKKFDFPPNFVYNKIVKNKTRSIVLSLSEPRVLFYKNPFTYQTHYIGIKWHQTA